MERHPLKEALCFLRSELFAMDLLLLSFAVVNSWMSYTSTAFIYICIFSKHNIHIYLFIFILSYPENPNM